MPEAGAGWRYAPSTRVVAASLDALPDLTSGDGPLLLVTSAGFVRRGLVARVAGLLGKRELRLLDSVDPNPDLDMLDAEISRWRAAGITEVVGLGGGSVLDAAKVIAVCLPLPAGQTLASRFRQQQGGALPAALPMTAIPTTSGTGAEVTPFATVWDHAQKQKHSLAGPGLAPRVALLDASLTLGLPPAETLHTGLDALSHALESLWNRNRTPVSEALALRALGLLVDSLPQVLQDGSLLAARARMQNASLLAGMAISTTRTAICHALSYPFTSHFDVPHGLACSFTLDEVLRRNLDTLPEARRMRGLYTDVLALLDGLGLASRMQPYLEACDIRAFLEAQPLAADRAGNYQGAPLPETVEWVSKCLVRPP